jgi:hypothetical protein
LPHTVNIERRNGGTAERRNGGFGIMTRDDARASVTAVIEAPGPLEAVSIAMLATRTAISAAELDGSFDTSNAVLRVAPADQAELIYDRTEPWVLPPSSWPDEG